MEDNKIRVGITQGDINGVGYEVILKAFSDPVMLELCTPVIYGSPKVAAYHRKSLDLPTNFSIVSSAAEALLSDDLYKYLNILFGSVNQKKIDSVVLGCTHYPFAINAIKNVVGDDVKIFDGGEGTAREMRRRLGEAGLINNRGKKGKVKFINSKDTEEEKKLCEFLLNLKMQ